ncbi:unnamed protein product [Porites evermanni]|uniref:Saccharopine dehydrogenase (NAD(+), L-lysine-forming) n=1 Tax=Porites evermanni TaxID=104178 RepID=A0ABN8SJS1_9CNID|nr:unnamed protein product [Porites evermanni]
MSRPRLLFCYPARKQTFRENDVRLVMAVHLWLRAETKPNERRTHITPERCKDLVQAGKKNIRALTLFKIVYKIPSPASASLGWKFTIYFPIQVCLRLSIKKFTKNAIKKSNFKKRTRHPLHDTNLFPLLVSFRVQFKLKPHPQWSPLGMAPLGSWTSAPKGAFIVGLKELPETDDPVTHRHIFYAHAYKNQTGWAELLYRFVRGGGSIYDIEFMCDDTGKCVVPVFSTMAGLCGMAVGVIAWCHQQLNPDVALPSVSAYDNEDSMLNFVKSQLQDIAKKRGVAKVFPRILVVGALGRCGKGAIEMLLKMGIPKSNIAEWDIAETRAGGPFPEILQYDIFVNCILLTEVLVYPVERDFFYVVNGVKRNCGSILMYFYVFYALENSPVHYQGNPDISMDFLTRAMNLRSKEQSLPPPLLTPCLMFFGLTSENRYFPLIIIFIINMAHIFFMNRSLSIVVDISCDASSPNNPLPFYDTCTSFKEPTCRVKLNKSSKPLDVVAIDHFPSLLPRESSTRFADDSTPHLLKLTEVDSYPVWVNAKKMFDLKAAEAEALLKK